MKYINILLIIFMSVFQTSCDGEESSDSWRALRRMKAKDYFHEPLQIKLADAISKGDTDKIKDAIKQGVDVNGLGKDGMRPLFWALGKKNIKGFEILLQNGADPNIIAEITVKDEDPPSVMKLCAISENSDYLRLALTYGGNSNFDAGYGNRTIIFEAILNNRIENIRVLINNGVNLSHQDSAGQTPIITAASINNYYMVYLFLMKGGDPTIKDRWGYDLAGMIKLYGDRGIKHGGDQYKWYLKVLEEMKQRGLLEK